MSPKFLSHKNCFPFVLWRVFGQIFHPWAFGCHAGSMVFVMTCKHPSLGLSGNLLLFSFWETPSPFFFAESSPSPSETSNNLWGTMALSGHSSHSYVLLTFMHNNSTELDSNFRLPVALLYLNFFKKLGGITYIKGVHLRCAGWWIFTYVFSPETTTWIKF